LLAEGAHEIGFSRITPPEEFSDLCYAVTIVVHLSDAVINSISQGPTHTYFHHYRTVNAFLDRLSLRAGQILEEHGARYVCIPASQSISGLAGLFSHKQAAVAAGLGCIGKSALFLSEKYGPRVRLATVLTDVDLSGGFKPAFRMSPCENCNLCVGACPAMAISGKTFEQEGNNILDRAACSRHMKEAYQRIGRGAVCGICMSVCPAGKNRKNM